MSDTNKGMPVRSLNDTDEKVQSKIVDFTSPSNGLTVDSDGNAHVELHGNDPSGTDTVLLTAESGHLAIDGIYDGVNNTDPSNLGLIGHSRAASPADTDQTVRLTSAVPADDLTNANIHALDVNSFLMGYDSGSDQWDRVQITSGALDVNIASSSPLEVNLDGVYDAGSNTTPDSAGVVWHSRATSPGDAEQTFRPTGVQGTADDSIHAVDVALHDQAGDAFSRSNPLPVFVAEKSGGDDVHDHYDNSLTDVAAGGTDNHDYTVSAGKTLILQQVQGSSSVRGRFELQVETGVATGTFDTKGVWFTTESNQNFSEKLENPIEIPSGVIVRIVRKNRSIDDPACMYSFLNGVEV